MEGCCLPLISVSLNVMVTIFGVSSLEEWEGEGIPEKWELWVPMWRIQGFPKYGPMIDDVTWLSKRLMLMAGMSAGMAGLWGEKSWRTRWKYRGKLNFPPAKGIFCLLRKASCKNYLEGSHLFLISSCCQLLKTRGTASVFWMMMSVHLII